MPIQDIYCPFHETRTPQSINIPEFPCVNFLTLLFFVLKDHYDFGMRAVKTVISAAGNIKREHPTLNEVPTL